MVVVEPEALYSSCRNVPQSPQPRSPYPHSKPREILKTKKKRPPTRPFVCFQGFRVDFKSICALEVSDPLVCSLLHMSYGVSACWPLSLCLLCVHTPRQVGVAHTHSFCFWRKNNEGVRWDEMQ